MIIGGWNNSRNPSHPFPRIANLECIKKTLSEIPKKKPECVAGSWKQIRPLLTNKLPLRIGAVTDCFQRYMESKTHTGLELLRILSDIKYPAQIVTKSDVIAESDYIDAMKDNKNNLLLQLSSTSPSDAISRVIESGAPPTSHRIKALSKLVKEGFFTAVRINPLFPIFPDKTLVKLSKETDIRGISLIKRAKELKVKKLPIFDLTK
jgi:DNA repair photolyase